ncbi:MAG: DNA repair protein RadC [Candidatus Aminicenantes bacterium]|nr:DNA repair protein RadC [Candidatus Aminicenantes bacterium]
MKGIKELPEFSRPREKLKEKGAQALSDAELIAVLLRSGIKGQEVRTLAAEVGRLLAEKKGNIAFQDLAQIKGIGLAKAAQILAAFELARRHLLQETVKITGARDVLPLLNDIAGKQQEYFVCISLNGAHEVIEKRIVTVGLLDKSQVHPREVFADVIADRAAAVILAHNHPSGDLKPSNRDLKIHEQLTEAGTILGIRILDHIIVCRKGYYSFQEAGLIVG